MRPELRVEVACGEVERGLSTAGEEAREGERELGVVAVVAVARGGGGVRVAAGNEVCLGKGAKREAPMPG